MSGTPEKKLSIMSSVVTAGRLPSTIKDAQNIQALVGAAVRAGEGVIAFVRTPGLGNEAEALTESMVRTANEIKLPEVNQPTIQSKL